jgi:hypothetical protein
MDKPQMIEWRTTKKHETNMVDLRAWKLAVFHIQVEFKTFTANAEIWLNALTSEGIWV